MYTIRVKEICESLCDIHANGLTYDEVIEKTWFKIFDFYFPIFDLEYTETLCRKILKHYFMDEIGQETVELFKLSLNCRMNEIMPKYNKLYELLSKVSPLQSFSSEKTLTRTGDTNENTNDNGESETNTETESTNKYSDTPQGGLDGLRNDRYMSEATIVNDTSNNKQTNTNNKEFQKEYNEKESFNQTNYGGTSIFRDIVEFSESYNDVDMMIINDLENLFMGLWQ